MNVTPSKAVAGRTYVHASNLQSLPAEVKDRIASAARLAKIDDDTRFNVVRLEIASSRIALLNYPEFFDEAFPILRESWLVDLKSGHVGYRTYASSQNPPILHRKELLLPRAFVRYTEYEALTRAAESIGLFDDPTRIGFREQWFDLIRSRGYSLVGHELIPIANDETNDEGSTADATPTIIARHLTALTRYGFSAPVQSLAQHGFLDGPFTIFDYGCGRGDDVRGLLENGLKASGWDPYFAPGNPVLPASIVNLGFVINVIEDTNERAVALKSAFSLCEILLAVSTMLSNQNAMAGQRFADGVVTRRGTFQKYYTQSELKEYLQEVLGEEPVAVGPGIYYIFRDKDAEQRFLSNRFRSRRSHLPSASHAPRPERTPKPARDLDAERYELFREPLDRLWAKWLSLGREPVESEVGDLLALVEGFGSIGRALSLLARRNDLDAIEISRNARVGDLTVYLALNLFEKRHPYKHLERSLQRDIREFFGSFTSAQQVAKDLLAQVSNPAAVAAACKSAADRGLGWLIHEDSLQLHVSLVDQLPPLLRVYIGCAAALYGDYRNADLIKVHIRSSKLTLMRFDDFEGKPLPSMVERVKILMRRRDFQFFGYGEDYEPPFLYFKSRYINEEFSNYPAQVLFDETLSTLPFLDLSGFGPRPDLLLVLLKQNRWTIDDFTLIRSQSIPTLDDRCGKNFTYRDLIECGATQARTKIPNLPKQPDSYAALFDLAVNILDPVIEYFGMIKLTYGFCSTDLGKNISARVAPELDQHAAHEKKRNGKDVCDRLGAAVDFIVVDEDMRSVASWIVENTPFDRLYIYGADRPLHVSFGPQKKGMVFEMVPTARGGLIPRTIVPGRAPR